MAKPKKVLLLGSNALISFLGQNLSDHYHITATTPNQSDSEFKKAFYDEVVHVEFPNYEFIYSAIHQYDIVVEGINLGGRVDSQGTYAESVRYPVAQHFNKALSESQESRLQTILYIGSGTVYGDCKGGLVKETSPTYPNTKESNFGLLTEKEYLGCISSKLNVIVFRCGTFEEVKDKIIKYICSLAKKTPLKHTGFKFVNVLTRKTLLRAVRRVLESGKSNIYNIADGDAKTFRFYVYHYLQKTGQDNDFLKWGSAYEDINYSLDCSRAKKDNLIG